MLHDYLFLKTLTFVRASTLIFTLREFQGALLSMKKNNLFTYSMWYLLPVEINLSEIREKRDDKKWILSLVVKLNLD